MKREVERVYALVRCADGRWLLLNRRYKPFDTGASPRAWFNYDECDGIRVWLRQRDLKRLDGGDRPYRPGDSILWLWHDGTNPARGAALLRAYQKRLALLDFEKENAA